MLSDGSAFLRAAGKLFLIQKRGQLARKCKSITAKQLQQSCHEQLYKHRVSHFKENNEDLSVFRDSADNYFHHRLLMVIFSINCLVYENFIKCPSQVSKSQVDIKLLVLFTLQNLKLFS